MRTQISATFVGGVLKPDEELPLAEETRVRLIIEPITEPRDPMAAWESLKVRLRERPIHAGVRYTRDELYESR